VANVAVVEHHRVPLVASLLALGAGVVWSFGALLARMSTHTDAWQYLVWRSIGVFVVMEIVSRRRGHRWMVTKAFRGGRTMMAGNASLLLASLAFVYAVKNTSAANAAFLASVGPIIAVLLARVFLGERLTRVTIVATAVAFAGLLIMVTADLGVGNMRGNISAVFSAVGFAAYTVCLRTDPSRDWSPIMPGYAVMMVGLCSVVTLANGKTLLPPARDMIYAMVHGGAVIVIGTLLYNVGSRTVPAVAMTVFAQTEMVFVPIWIFLRFSERPRSSTLLGGAIILAAVVGKALLDARPQRFAIAPVAVDSPNFL
jgi:drug/metabolite transporter, DME family